MIHYNDEETAFGTAIKGYIVCLIILCALLFLSACATPRNAETDKQTDYTSDFNWLKSQMESLRADFSKQTNSITDKMSNLKVENRTVILSPPDSTGRQYPIQESTTTATKDDQERQEVNETTTLSIDKLDARIDSLSNTVNTFIKEQSKVVELSWWDLYKDKIYAAILVVILVLSVLKRKS